MSCPTRGLASSFPAWAWRRTESEHTVHRRLENVSIHQWLCTLNNGYKNHVLFVVDQGTYVRRLLCNLAWWDVKCQRSYTHTYVRTYIAVKQLQLSIHTCLTQGLYRGCGVWNMWMRSWSVVWTSNWSQSAWNHPRQSHQMVGICQCNKYQQNTIFAPLHKSNIHNEAVGTVPFVLLTLLAWTRLVSPPQPVAVADNALHTSRQTNTTVFSFAMLKKTLISLQKLTL